VRNFEAGEIRATLEMQRAAREVAWVNERLLELLALKGVGRGEVDTYLSKTRKGVEGANGEDQATSTNVDDEPEAQFLRGGTAGLQRAALLYGDCERLRLCPPARTLPSPSMPVQATSQTPVYDDHGIVVVGNCEAAAVNENENEEQDFTNRLVHANGGNICPPGSSKMATTRRQTRNTTEATGNNQEITSTSTSICTAAPGVTLHSPPALVTSCDDAANIIADFQGHGDPLRARSALGCGDSTDCHVKNTTLFQLMDETK
jgi:hypothetical protein